MYEQVQLNLSAAEARVQRAEDRVGVVLADSGDAAGGARQLTARVDRLGNDLLQLSAAATGRKAEVGSIVRVVRMMLDDAEMRCAIDEADGSASPQLGGSPDDLSPRPSPRGPGIMLPGGGGAGGSNGLGNGVQPLRVKGLGRAGAASLAPLDPRNDKVWYKSTLVPRSELLGQRRRLLVSARHSWVGDTCLGRADDAPSGPAHAGAPHGGGACGARSRIAEDVDRPAYEELPMPEPPGPARHRTMPPRA
jgi:hypothetical protein